MPTFETYTLAGHTVTYSEARAFLLDGTGQAMARHLAESTDDPTRMMEMAAQALLASRHALFEAGRLVATPSALAALNVADETPGEIWTRHLCGDWGIHGHYTEIEIDDDIQANGPMTAAEDSKLNKAAVEQGEGRIMSAYVLSTGETLWVITEDDRSATTLLLPEEY